MELEAVRGFWAGFPLFGGRTFRITVLGQINTMVFNRVPLNDVGLLFRSFSAIPVKIVLHNLKPSCRVV